MFPIRNGQRLQIVSTDGSVSIVRSGGYYDLSVQQGFPPPQVGYEVDWAALGTQNLAPDGDYLIGDRTWNTFNTATATTLQVLAGGGVNFVAAANNTNVTDAGITAATLWIELQDLIPEYDPTQRWIFQAHVSASNADAASERTTIGLWRPGGTPTGSAQAVVWSYVGRNASALSGGLQAGTTAPVGFVDYTFAAGYNAPAISADPASPSGAVAYAGQYDAGWPALADLRDQGWSQQTAVVAALTAPRFTDPDTRLAISFPTGNTTATFASTVRRLRALRVG